MLSSLLEEFAGKVDLIYIDPPFATGADFSYKTQVGDEDVEKLPSMLEEVAYRDMWFDGMTSYIAWFAPFFSQMSQLLKPNGSFYLHCDPTASHYLKLLADEEFGRNNFRNEITWKRRTESHNRAISQMGRIHDVIMYYGKSSQSEYRIQYMPYDSDYIAQHYKFKDSRGLYATFPCTNEMGGNRPYEFKGITRAWRFGEQTMRDMYEDDRLVQLRPGSPFRYKKYLDEAEGVKLQDIWDDIPAPRGRNAVGYPTQKPLDLVERVIRSSSDEGGLVLDCFIGSGTTAIAAENLQRRWIGVDIGRFAVQTTRKRLLDIPGCRPFEIQNLGRYERSYWQGVDSTGGNNTTVIQYIDFILDLYKARPIPDQFRQLHGIREGVAVHVGGTDSPVSADELRATVDECVTNGFVAVDVLGWEWEMGLNPALRDELMSAMGVKIRLMNIPREILDQRNIDAGDVNFFELSIADARVSSPYRLAVQVELTEFIPAVDEYMQQRLSSVPTEWSDWIDYWSVDFEYDGEVFVNQWQSYRTRQDRSLNLVSDPHEYEESGLKSIVVKVIDIFGNDTTVELEYVAGDVS